MRIEIISTGVRRTGRAGRLAAHLAFALMLASPAVSQPQPAAPAVAAEEEPPHQKPAHDPGARVSKFEARHIRHACRERANERGLKGQDRERYLSRCFFGRRVNRKERRECAKLAAAQGLDKAAQRDFAQKCVAEKRGARPAD